MCNNAFRCEDILSYMLGYNKRILIGKLPNCNKIDNETATKIFMSHVVIFVNTYILSVQYSNLKNVM